MTSIRHLGWRRTIALLLALAVLGAAVAWLNPLGVRTRLHEVVTRLVLIVDPPPDRPVAETVHVSSRESPSPTPTPAPTPLASVGGTSSGAPPSAAPTVTPTPMPQRAKVDVNVLQHPENHFVSEQANDTWCAVAGTQMVLNIWGKAPTTLAFEKELASRIGEWESRRDSLNGGWGPSAIAAALDAYGVHGYEVRAYDTRADALYDAARAIEKQHAPVLLMAWRGAHTWVMTGFRADADPLVFGDATVKGAYILDPWYPLISSIWGPSDPPGSFEDLQSMRINYLPWKRPEGHYKDRDGLFIAVVPTQPLNR